MKVCTDACLFGAWVANKIQEKDFGTNDSGLDLGTGTGLLALMLAQQFPGCIHAIDIDADAARQATENAAASPWANKITVHHSAADGWNKTNYKIIVANPPFYEQDLRSADRQRNLALHDTGLTLVQLWNKVAQCLHPAGFFAVLLPHHRLNDCLHEAGNRGFLLVEKVLVHQTEKHAPFRVMLLFDKQTTNPAVSAINIKEDGHYSTAFASLLKAYYLYL